jgi:hypothetical protein
VRRKLLVRINGDASYRLAALALCGVLLYGMNASEDPAANAQRISSVAVGTERQ